ATWRRSAPVSLRHGPACPGHPEQFRRRAWIPRKSRAMPGFGCGRARPFLPAAPPSKMAFQRAEKHMDAQSDWTGLDPARLERIGERLSRDYVDAGRIAGCQVAVWRRGREAYARSIGLADAERGVPMRGDAIHRIYSMTKPITSVALMTL